MAEAGRAVSLARTFLAKLSPIRCSLAGTKNSIIQAKFLQEAMSKHGIVLHRIPFRAALWLPSSGEALLYSTTPCRVDPLPPTRGGSIEGLGVVYKPGRTSFPEGAIAVIDARGLPCSELRHLYGHVARLGASAVLFATDGPVRCVLYPDPLPPRAADAAIPAYVLYGCRAAGLLSSLPSLIRIRGAVARRGYGYDYLLIAGDYEASRVVIVPRDYWLSGGTRLAALASAIAAYIAAGGDEATALVVATGDVYGEDMESSLFWGAGGRRLTEYLSSARLWLDAAMLTLGPLGLSPPTHSWAWEEDSVDFCDAWSISPWLRGAGFKASSLLARSPLLSYIDSTWLDTPQIVAESVLEEATRKVLSWLRGHRDPVTATALLAELLNPLIHEPLPYTRREVYRLLRLAKRSEQGSPKAEIVSRYAAAVFTLPIQVSLRERSTVVETLACMLSRGLPRNAGELVYWRYALGGGFRAYRVLDRLIAERLRLAYSFCELGACGEVLPLLYGAL